MKGNFDQTTGKTWLMNNLLLASSKFWLEFLSDSQPEIKAPKRRLSKKWAATQKGCCKMSAWLSFVIFVSIGTKLFAVDQKTGPKAWSIASSKRSNGLLIRVRRAASLLRHIVCCCCCCCCCSVSWSKVKWSEVNWSELKQDNWNVNRAESRVGGSKFSCLVNFLLFQRNITFSSKALRKFCGLSSCKFRIDLSLAAALNRFQLGCCLRFRAH